MSRIQAEIKQTKPFPVAEEEAAVALQRTADLMAQQITAVLKPHGISPAQYNVLRILRGAGKDGLPCGEVGNRMVTRDPDMTRLLDRMETRGLVARIREQKDRRVITARITPEGEAMVGQLDRPIAELSVRQFSALTKAQLKTLVDLLDRLRELAD
ncbi:MAG: MarR family transcriptional regulator [Bryobacteraceae bacterium]